MLSIRNMTKIYHTKGGVEVRALDNVSLDFPERGMVFLLGKSGSGKSTLLNMIGGLDSFDSGELIIKGRSSRDFHGSDFDAYRNTFIGFIFQEYNILDEFTVGANIALALQLQGKKVTDEAINRILEQVDLTGYGKRKPNELSGGQKQRIAIARALIKEPEIIMADEPTGALDSDTGKQVLETLKRLSREKLVIVVSHDRDFAETYGDRIIELSDGRIISDMSLSSEEGEEPAGVRVIGEDLIRIRRGYHLTDADRKMINAYLDRCDRDVILSRDEQLNGEICRARGISDASGTSGTRRPTGKVETREYQAKDTRFIKSHLPLRHAFRMGVSSLKHKTVRLIFSIILSVIAFSLFGISDTMAAYRQSTAVTDSIVNRGLTYTSFGLKLRHYWHSEYDGEVNEGSRFEGPFFSLNAEDIARIEERVGKVIPVYNGTYSQSGLSLRQYLTDVGKLSNTSGLSLWSATAFGSAGVAEMSQSDFDRLGISLTGRAPAAADEVVIPEFLFTMFREAGVDFGDGTPQVKAGALTMDDDPLTGIIGRTITLWQNDNPGAHTFRIVGVADTRFPYEKFAAFRWDSKNAELTDLELLFATSTLENETQYGIHTVLFVQPGLVDTLPSPVDSDGENHAAYLNNGSIRLYIPGSNGDNYYQTSSVLSPDWLSDLNDLILAADRDAGAPLSSREILFPLSALRYGLTISLPQGETPADRETVNNLFGISLTEEEWEEWQGYLWNGGMLDLWGIERAFWIDWLIRNQDAVLSAAANDEGFRMMIRERYDSQLLPENFPDDPDERAGKIRELVNVAFEYLIESTANVDGKSSGRIVNPLTGDDDTAKYDAFLSRLLAQDAVREALTLSVAYYRYPDNGGDMERIASVGDFRVVGFYRNRNDYYSSEIVSEELYALCEEYNREYDSYAYRSWYAEHTPGKYDSCIVAVPSDRAGVEKLVELSLERDGDYNYTLRSDILTLLDSFDSTFEILRQVFRYVGLALALFASLLLLNFISTSVAFKRREIGILRAVGARSADVFSIFFSEAFVIALINFVLSAIGTGTAVFFINRVTNESSGLGISLLHFGIRQIVLLFAVSVLVSFLASFLPVSHIARKKPVDAIKNL